MWRRGQLEFREYDDSELLARARRNLGGCVDWLADDLARLGTRWQTLSRQMRSATGRFRSVAEAVHFAQTSCEFEDRPRTAHESQFFTLYKAQLASEFPALAAHIDAFADSPLSDPATVYRHKGRVVSKVLFFQARYVLFCLTWLPRPPQRILEIGGGVRRTGATLAHQHNRRTTDLYHRRYSRGTVLCRAFPVRRVRPGSRVLRSVD